MPRPPQAARLLAPLLILSLTGCAALPSAPGTAPAAPAPAAAPADADRPRPAAAPQPAPALTNLDGAPWTTTLPSLIQYVQWLRANPAEAPALLANVAVPGCDGHNQLQTHLAALDQSGVTVSPVPPLLTSITLLDQPAAETPAEPAAQPQPAALPPQIALHVRAVRGQQQVLSAATNQVAYNLPRLPPTTFHVSLLLGPDNRWRICGTNPLNEVPRAQATIW